MPKGDIKAAWELYLTTLFQPIKIPVEGFLQGEWRLYRVVRWVCGSGFSCTFLPYTKEGNIITLPNPEGQWIEYLSLDELAGYLPQEIYTFPGMLSLWSTCDYWINEEVGTVELFYVLSAEDVFYRRIYPPIGGNHA
jgi:hypothetical protein